MLTARQWVEQGRRRLEAAGVPEALIKMEWWVSEALGIRRDALDSAPADAEAGARIEAGLVRLEKHEPLQYVIGHAPFLDLQLRTDARALIPRPETEELVMRILACEALWRRGEVALADVGTGTGCIAIALAAARPAARVVALDVSRDALDLARENAVRHQVDGRVAFRLANLLEGIAPESLDAVVSNPPYIARGVWTRLEPSVRDYEPRQALEGGPDGLELIRKLIVQAFTALKKNGRLWLEIGDEQGSAVRDLLALAGFRGIDVHRDMFGQTRFAEAIK